MNCFRRTGCSSSPGGRIGKSHNVRKRDDWLLHCHTLAEHSFVASSYLNRADLSCSSAAFARRRWLVIESDTGTLEEQFAIHRQLDQRFGHLGCVCSSGGKSLHGWYFVHEWTERQCFELYASAIRLGVNDCNTWRISQMVRLPGGWNHKTNQRQLIYLWKPPHLLPSLSHDKIAN